MVSLLFHFLKRVAPGCVHFLLLPMALAQPLELLTFGEKDDLRRWTKDTGATVAYSERYALNHAHSLHLQTPAWKPQGNEWPMWRYTGELPADWTGYDQLVVEVVNPSSAPQLLGMKVADEATAKLTTGNWLGVKATIEPYSHARVIQPLSVMLKGIVVRQMDRRTMKTLLFYATRPIADFDLHISAVYLLKKGESPRPLPPEYLTELVNLRLPPLRDQGRAALAKLGPEETSLKEEWEAMENQLNKGYEELTANANAAEALIRKMKRSGSLTPLHEEAKATGYAVAWASSVEKVIPREMPLDQLDLSPEMTLRVARRETESVQVVVVPFAKDLEEVSVTIATPFLNQAKKPLPASAITITPVGFVKTETPAYDYSFVGWWPDPLLSFLNSVDIKKQEAQSFWLRVRPEAEVPAGTYQGEILITAKGQEETRRKLTIHVRDFTLPPVAPIPVVFPAPTEGILAKLTDEPWEKLKFQWSDFLADYYIGWDNLYVPQAPDWEILERLREQGRLSQFNLYPVGFGGVSYRKQANSGAFDPEVMNKLLAALDENVQEAKKRKLLPYAYLYGMDEIPGRYEKFIRAVAREVKMHHPELPLSTTASDPDYGVDGVEEIDIWIPLIHHYDQEKAEIARSHGRKVWWYTCTTPAHPFPNVFTEYPLMDLRIMQGAMSALYQPDGFLYYSLLRIWLREGKPPRTPITTGPYTDWDPCALAYTGGIVYNGEGYLVYPGPKGSPLASIRLENFRDGLEDLWYWKLLERQVKAAHAATEKSEEAQAWLAKAEAALVVPKTLVTSSHQYSLDFHQLQQWRNRLGDLIETSPYPL